MKYFEDLDGNVYGYDELQDSQIVYIEEAIKNNWKDITGFWPRKETIQQAKNRLLALVTNIIDSTAQNFGYDNILSAVSYLSSTNQEYADDAKTLSMWRDKVWEWAIPALENVKPEESEKEFLSSIPKIPKKEK